MREGVEKYSRRPLDPSTWGAFEPRLFYHRGSITEAATYEGLKLLLEQVEGDQHLPGHRIFYLAVPPDAFAPICQGLQRAGLAYPADSTKPFCRIIVEKPIGHDLNRREASIPRWHRFSMNRRSFASIITWAKRRFRI